MFKFNPKCSFIKDLYKLSEENLSEILDKTYELWGHVKNIREQSNLIFISLYDGTHITPFQLILDLVKYDKLNEYKSVIYPGAYIKVQGIIVKSPAKGQLIEMQVTDLNHAGPVVDNTNYLPLVKKITLDTLRGKNIYLRPKFQTYQAVYSIIDKTDKFINDFMRHFEFKKIDPNILTGSDCEGAGEMFVVTNLLKDNISDIPTTKDGKIDYSKDFFNKKVGLTVSSQLQLETLCPMGKGVYTMNKSFRAEKSKTSRHLAEFTHLEVESKLITDVSELMNFEEDLLTYIIKRTLDECKTELEYLNSYTSKGIIDKLNSFIKEDFGRITYTDAIKIVQRDKDKIKKIYDFNETINWGDDLGSYCERYIAEYIFGKPVFIYNYPKKLKSFYMKQNLEPDTEFQTVAAVDLIVNKIGEVAGGSIRESNYDLLIKEMDERNMSSSLPWYTDLRKNGSMVTGGMGFGVSRIVQMLCYMDSNIRDATPFPVAYTEADF